MAKSFDAVNAKRLIEKHEKTLENLHSAAEMPERFRSQTNACADKLADADIMRILREISVDEMNDNIVRPRASLLKACGYVTLADVVEASERELRSDLGMGNAIAAAIKDAVDEIVSKAKRGTRVHLSADRKMPEADALIRAASGYMRCGAIASEAQRFIDENESDIRYALDDLRAFGGSFLKRIFISGRQKQRAQEAFEKLSDLEDGEYGAKAEALTSMMNGIVRNGEAWEDFQKQPDAFITVLNGIRPGCFENSRENERGFDRIKAKRLVEWHSKTLKQLQKAADMKLDYRMEAVAAAEGLAAAEAVEVLREIPVEELNRERKGIRVKALRDYGYNSILDVLAASEGSLSSVYGISEDTAYTIKRIANDIASKARQGTKIRISSDRKTRETTRLISAVAKYMLCAAPAEACRDLYERNERRIRYAVDDIGELCDGKLKWLLASGKEKERAMAAFETLKTLEEGSYFADTEYYLKLINSIDRMTEAEAWNDFSENPVEFFNIIEKLAPGLLGNDDSLYGLPEDLAREIQDECFFPDGLLCELRRYQEWGVKYILHQQKVLLGDEMGLGKTVQAIAAMVSLRNTGATHFMVVCPASVLTNWCREIRKMSRLSVTKIHGVGRSSALRSWIKTGGTAVTTYETTSHISFPEGFGFSMLVVDEAHYAKNPEAKRTKNIKLLCQSADRLLFMTGTPLENSVGEMYQLIKMLQPSVAYAIQDKLSLSSAPQFRKAIAPVYYRRKRDEVLTELPELIESREWCTMYNVERAVYENALRNGSGNYAEARRLSWNVGEGERSSKAERLLELVEEARAEGRKVLVFSFFLDTIRRVKSLLKESCLNPINGSVTLQRRQEIIDEFEKAPAGTVLAAQIQAGGTGLNIQSASVVIICEPQFKPSIENQAISRAYRMGQTRNVLVYRLLCERTLEERMVERLDDKQREFDAFADKSEAARESLELDEKTFKDIIKEEIDRINAEQNGKSAEADRSEEEDEPLE